MTVRSQAQILPRHSFGKGQVLFREGDVGDRAFVVEKGAVEIAQVRDGARKVLGTIGDGGVFGEMALIDNQPRMAEAVALKDTTCLVIGRDAFRERLDRADPFLRALLRIFVHSVRSLSAKT